MRFSWKLVRREGRCPVAVRLVREDRHEECANSEAIFSPGDRPDCEGRRSLALFVPTCYARGIELRERRFTPKKFRCGTVTCGFSDPFGRMAETLS